MEWPNLSNENNADKMTQEKYQAYSELISKFQDKTPMLVLLELLKFDPKYRDDISHLTMITEMPNVKYTLLLSKLSTWRTSVKEVFHLEENETDVIIRDMEFAFQSFMVSHKRRRAIEIVQGVKQGDGATNINVEKKRGLFGNR